MYFMSVQAEITKVIPRRSRNPSLPLRISTIPKWNSWKNNMNLKYIEKNRPIAALFISCQTGPKSPNYSLAEVSLILYSLAEVEFQAFSPENLDCEKKYIAGRNDQAIHRRSNINRPFKH